MKKPKIKKLTKKQMETMFVEHNMKNLVDALETLRKRASQFDRALSFMIAIADSLVPLNTKPKKSK